MQTVSTTEVVAAAGSVGAAVGTVGALFAAIHAIRAEQDERARAEVRGFRCWMEPQSGRDERHPHVMLLIENATDEVLYDVRARVVAPTVMRGGEMSTRQQRLTPGTKRELPGFSSPDLAEFDFSVVEGSGAEATFTDGRGHRWHREANGRLRRVKPARLYAPWRIVPRLDRDVESRWALASKWQYRHVDYGYRVQDHLSPPWWAVDIRWQRWRYARRHCPVPYRWWSVRTRWNNRRDICQRRWRQSLPLPWWAVDQLWLVWKNNRADRRRARHDDKVAEREWEHYMRTGQKPAASNHQARGVAD